MNDAAIYFALIALLALGWPVALVMWLEGRKWGREAVDNRDGWNLAVARAERLRADLAKFDHDGDGKPGGSKQRQQGAVR